MRLRKLFWIALSVVAILIVFSIVFISVYSFKRLVPQDCFSGDALKLINSNGAVKTFKRTYPESSFEVIEPRNNWSSQCHYWFFHTDGKKQENLWILIDNDRLKYGAGMRMYFDNPGLESVYIDRFNMPDITQEYCK